MIALTAIVLLVWVSSIYNGFVRQEKRLAATHEKAKNALSTMGNDIRSQGLTTEKYGQMVMKAIDAAISGRYGKTGVQGRQFLP